MFNSLLRAFYAAATAAADILTRKAQLKQIFLIMDHLLGVPVRHDSVEACTLQPSVSHLT